MASQHHTGRVLQQLTQDPASQTARNKAIVSSKKGCRLDKGKNLAGQCEAVIVFGSKPAAGTRHKKPMIGCKITMEKDECDADPVEPWSRSKSSGILMQKCHDVETKQGMDHKEHQGDVQFRDQTRVLQRLKKRAPDGAWTKKIRESLARSKRK